MKWEYLLKKQWTEDDYDHLLIKRYLLDLKKSPKLKRGGIIILQNTHRSLNLKHLNYLKTFVLIMKFQCLKVVKLDQCY